MKCVWALVTVVITAVSGGCDAFSRSCTEVGCGNGASLTLRTADGTWLSGVYSLTLAIDGETHLCPMTLPQDIPTLGSVGDITCEPELGFSGVSLVQDTICTEQRSGDSVSQTCKPIPEHYTLQVMVQGMPELIGVKLTMDMMSVVEESISLEYEEHRPNGEGCEPVCQQAGATITIAQ